MNNNKGFSLVELIIVIAIMAILVGVMAPQLIKYIEKTNVSSDTQLCDTVKTAVTTAVMDPEVLNEAASVTKIGTWSSPTALSTIANGSGSKAESSVLEALGVTSGANANSQLKSSNAASKGVTFQVMGSNSVHVWIANTDNRGKKGATGWVNSLGANSNWIYVD